MTRSRVNEMEFLDIYSIKDCSLLLHATHSSSTDLQKPIFYSDLKIHTQKICVTRKFESIHE
jgi:hypothetical protein